MKEIAHLHNELDRCNDCLKRFHDKFKKLTGCDYSDAISALEDAIDTLEGELQ